MVMLFVDSYVPAVSEYGRCVRVGQAQASCRFLLGFPPVYRALAYLSALDFALELRWGGVFPGYLNGVSGVSFAGSGSLDWMP